MPAIRPDKPNLYAVKVIFMDEENSGVAVDWCPSTYSVMAYDVIEAAHKITSLVTTKKPKESFYINEVIMSVSCVVV